MSNIPNYVAPAGKNIGSTGLTDDVKAGHAQVAAITTYINSSGLQGYTDNQAKDAALQAILATSTITATYNTTTRLLSVNVRTGSLTVAHLDPAALATGALTSAQQTALSNAANWTAKVYNSGTLVLTGIPAGTTYDDANYLYYFASDNRPVRIAIA